MIKDGNTFFVDTVYMILYTHCVSLYFFFSSRRRHTRFDCDWSSDVCSSDLYPIRPYDTVMQAIAKKIANGQLVAEYIVAEGEHSQFEIVKHASTVGARVF